MLTYTKSRIEENINYLTGNEIQEAIKCDKNVILATDIPFTHLIIYCNYFKYNLFKIYMGCLLFTGINL